MEAGCLANHGTTHSNVQPQTTAGKERIQLCMMAIPTISAPGRLRQDKHGFKASLGTQQDPSQNKQKNAKIAGITT